MIYSLLHMTMAILNGNESITEEINAKQVTLLLSSNFFQVTIDG